MGTESSTYAWAVVWFLASFNLVYQTAYSGSPALIVLSAVVWGLVTATLIKESF